MSNVHRSARGHEDGGVSDRRTGTGSPRGVGLHSAVDESDFDDLDASWKDRIVLAEPSGRVTLTEWRHRIAWYWEEPLVRVAVVVAVAFIALMMWYQLGTRSGGRAHAAASLGSPHTSLVEGVDGATSADSAGSQSGVGGGDGSQTATSEVPVTVNPQVHVAGAVNQAGVVRVAPGARVTDAITAAGGPTADADLTRINLAAPITDGQQVVVPVLGEPMPVVAAPNPAVPVVAGAPGASTTSGPVSINQASQSELETLPGVGPAIASAIMNERERRGGFASVEELLEVRGIGEQRLADLRDHITL
ncbi:MAG: helix-hairpin-helix domain-containing protein [Actinobacteria bacterium]|nr:helix-hairpin-helix domain-containing protein [Actinomycetota bacterium]MCB9388455.1 helix-hairpin-helix domain-containing protein [Acidimicrobiia bacterium]